MVEKKKKHNHFGGERERGTDRKEAREAIQIYLYIEEWEDDEKSWLIEYKEKIEKKREQEKYTQGV